MIAFANQNTRLRGYPTDMLPAGVDGQVAFDTDIGVPVYLFNGAWRRYSDDSIIASIAFDADALAYIAAVETADGEPLEAGVKNAINNFVVGCKSDGIWTSIKSSCILAGARTLSGALTPLVGTAPTNFNFVTGDYNRETGLLGNGTTKYLDSNRNNNADPQDNNHQAVWISTASSYGQARVYIGAGVVDSGTTHIVKGSTDLFFTRNRNSTSSSPISDAVVGFAGHSRATSSLYTTRVNATNYNTSVTFQVPYAGNVFVFATNPASLYADARQAFYSIGESLDLALLDARVSTLITAIGDAI
jgi:hypothetical protein